MKNNKLPKGIMITCALISSMTLATGCDIVDEINQATNHELSEYGSVETVADNGEESTEESLLEEATTEVTDSEITSEKDEWTKVELINSRISEVTESEEYTSASVKEREKMVLPVLADLEDKGYIKNLYYDKDSKTFTFQYYNDVLGGVMIKDWDPMMN